MKDIFKYVAESGNTIVFDMSRFVITSITGVSENSVSITTSKGTGQIGETYQNSTVSTRPITINGVIVGNDVAAKNILLSTIIPAVPAKLYHNDSYYLVVYPTSTPFVEVNDNFTRFQFSLLAPYPYWQFDQQTSTALSGVHAAFKFPINFTEPYKFGVPIQTAFLNIRHGGQVEVPFTATFFSKGAVENPKIENAVTGEFLLLNRTLQTSERVIVQITHDLTYVTSSLDGDIRGDLDIDSTLFALHVGDNVLKPTATSGLTSLEVSIDFAVEKVGVAVS
jgi:hypothetical protein